MTRRVPALLNVALDDPGRRAIGLLLFMLGLALEGLIRWSSSAPVVEFAKRASPVVFIASAVILVLSIPGMWRLRRLYPRDPSPPLGHASATRWTVFALVVGSWWGLNIATMYGLKSKDVVQRIVDSHVVSVGVFVALAAAFVSGSLAWSMITLATYAIPQALGVPWLSLLAILAALVGRQLSCPACGTTVGPVDVDKSFLREEHGYHTQVHESPTEDDVEVVDRYTGRSRNFTVRGKHRSVTHVPVVTRVFQVRRRCAACGFEDSQERRE